MQELSGYWADADSVGRAVAALLLVMSIATWVTILWKGWVLKRAQGDLRRVLPLFWEARSLADGRAQLQAMDRERVLLPLAEAASAQGLAHLQAGLVLLASIGSTAPFVGLLGTVWGIYHALVGIAEAGTITIERVSGPVGEALIMTAAGLAVAIPAVLAYNVFGKWVAACEAELEGFAHDLRELALEGRRDAGA